jgi:hypothetical protein
MRKAGTGGKMANDDVVATDEDSDVMITGSSNISDQGDIDEDELPEEKEPKEDLDEEEDEEEGTDSGAMKDEIW